MNTVKIALKYLNGIHIDVSSKALPKPENQSIVMSVIASMMQLGYIASPDLNNALMTLTPKKIANVYTSVIRELKSLKGADVEYHPMYPNFPQQVMEASDLELFINAVVHYWTAGQWLPDYDKLPREVLNEKASYKQIGLVNRSEFDKIPVMILSSNDSISATDKETITWFHKHRNTTFNKIGEIPFKENLCYFAGLQLEIENVAYVQNVVKTATDVLRIATYLSGGDISLAENTKFKSLPRPTRKTLVRVLENVIREEDVARHKNKWVRLFHNLHVGDYSEKVFNIAYKFRNNKPVETFNGKVESALFLKDVVAAVALLKTRPGDFARRLDHVLRLNKKKVKFVVDNFSDVANKVSTRVLLQVRGNLKNRVKDSNKRIVFPKGNTQKGLILRQEIPKMNVRVIQSLKTRIDHVLIERFSELDPLGKVWIDPELKLCPIPTQMRSASEGAFQVARGTRLPVGDKETLRLFIYWKGRDIDLSATFHDSDFNFMEHISYTNLRSSKYEAAHSGDITRATNGASEFIDVDIKSAIRYGARYVAMNVYVYSGPTFQEHDDVYAGWMTREKVKSGEIYEPKTVKQKADLTGASKNSIPVIFDLVERKAIWTDLYFNHTISGGSFIGNNVESNRAGIKDTIESMVDLNKTTLYELFKFHALGRGEVVEDIDDADAIFSVMPHDTNEEQINITPYDITTINSEYVI